MSASRDSFTAAIDDELDRLRCALLVDDSSAGLTRLVAGFESLGAQLAVAPFTGLVPLARGLVQVTDQVSTPEVAGAFLAAVEQAWTRWKDGGDASIQFDPAATVTPAAPAAPPAGSAPVADLSPAPVAAPAPVVSLDEDLEMLAMDPELAGLFISEALDHLGTIEAVVLQLEASPGDKKLLNDVFRPFHTIKGNAGALGVKSVQAVAHKVENLLDLGRSGKIPIGPTETDVILKAVDLLTTMISDLRPRLAGKPAADVAEATAWLLATVEALVNGGAVPQAPVPPAAPEPPHAASKAVEPTPAPTVVPVASPGPVAVPAMAAAPPEVAGPARRATDAAEQTSVKVDTRKLDNMVDMVGELVIVQSIINADPSLVGLNDERLSRNLAQLRRITSDLQRNAMSMRMVPIRQTFQKMARLVRDLSKKSGKVVDLALNGEDTELDRKVVEDINDPLMHMVRNSLDHGLEAPDVRESRGKARSGKLTLSAFHQGGNIVIAIADDGQGLNTEKILAKAVSQGLVRPGETPSPAEIHQLIFRPGFSTAEKITEISGRGVGMDVVRRNIDALRGRIEIQTAVGVGTTFLIKLPLTLAIVEGLLLRTGDQRFVLPTFAVRQSLRPAPDQVHSMHGQRLIQVRGELLPLVGLAELAGVGGGPLDPESATAVVIEDDGRRIAILVDELLGKQEVVIKSLGQAFAHVRGVAGGAILGDGRIGLILDAGGLIGLLRRSVSEAA